MDITSGTSFYDTINKLLVGFLILLPWINFDQEMGNEKILIISVFSWIVGIFFWAIFEKIRIFSFSNKFEVMLQDVYQGLTQELGVKLRDDDNEIVDINKTEYYKAYYAVQEKGLLGPVGILESFSAFFRNIIIVAIYWVMIYFLSMICVYCKFCYEKIEKLFNIDQFWINLCSFPYLALLIILIILAILSYNCFRKCTEKRIIKSVLMAYMLCQKNSCNKIAVINKFIIHS